MLCVGCALKGHGEGMMAVVQDKITENADIMRIVSLTFSSVPCRRLCGKEIVFLGLGGTG